MRKVLLLATFGISLTSILTACGTSGVTPSAATSAAAQQAQPTTQPTPAPSVLALSGNGDKVFPVSLQNGHYNVTWTASGTADAYFGITLHGADIPELIANTALNNPYFPGQPTGQSYFAASGGTEYTLEVKGPFAWTISFSPVP